MKRYEIREAMPYEMQAFYVAFSRKWLDIYHYRSKIFVAKGLFQDRIPVGMAGIEKRRGRLWAFLDIMPDSHQIGAFLILEMRRALVKLGRGHPIYVRIDENYPTAPELLRVLGFTPTAETDEDMRVYQWQA